MLEEAFALASELPNEAQDEFARWLIDELASEQRWSEVMGASAGKLSALADEARAEHERGTTETLDPSKL